MMKKTNAKHALVATLAEMMALSPNACEEQGGGSSTKSTSTAAVSTETKTEAELVAESQDFRKNGEGTIEDAGRPETMSQEDWEAMQEELVFRITLNYLSGRGACASTVYLAEALGYYEDCGISAECTKGGSIVATVGTRRCLWGTDRIATMLMSTTNGVDMTFVAGAHTGCKSIYVSNDSETRTAEDLKRKTVTIRDGIRDFDRNIIYRMLGGKGMDPTSGVEYLDIADNTANVTAMESSEIDASIFSGYFVIADYEGKMCKVCSTTPSSEPRGEACCVTTMNNDFPARNPAHTKYIIMAVRRTGRFARLHSEDAVQLMSDTNKMIDESENQPEFQDSLGFGLSDTATEEALSSIATDCTRLGAVQKKEMIADDVMRPVWTNVCLDTKVSRLTVGDPEDVDGCAVKVQQEDE